MGARNYHKRVLHSFNFQGGRSETVSLRTTRRVLQRVLVIVSGTVTLSTLPTSPQSQAGGMYNLIKNLELVLSGYDPATNRRYNSDTRVNLAGRYFGWAPPSVNAFQQSRINFLNPYTPIFANNSQIEDINFGSTDAQEFRCEYEIPFYVPNGRQHADFSLDLANLQFLDLRINMGELVDCIRPAGAAGTVEANVQVIVHELSEEDPLQSNGNNIYSQGYARTSYETDTIAATNNEYRRAINISGNLGQLAFIISNSATDAPLEDAIQNIRLERRNNGLIDLPARAVRSDNVRQFPLLGSSGSGSANFATMLKDTGIYIIRPGCDTYSGEEYLSQTPYLGRNDDSSDYILSITLDDGVTARLEVVRTSYEFSDQLAGISRPLADMNAIQRELSQAARDSANDRAAQVAAAATTGAGG